jgi:hypothetical protein
MRIVGRPCPDAVDAVVHLARNGMNLAVPVSGSCPPSRSPRLGAEEFANHESQARADLKGFTRA